MYLEFYGLKVKPFDITTNPNFLWLGEKHREALATLRYGIQGNMGFLLLTGGVGTGKTTLIYSLLNELGPEVAVANVPDPGLTPLDFYNYIAAAFGIDREFTTKGAFLASFARFLHEAHQNGKKILLVIDESQRLSDKLLEEIRLLSNIERQETKLINIFFVGQVEFNTVLARYQNRALRQRITVNYHISPFSEKETGSYIAHRLNVAGGRDGLFSEEAIHEIFTFSKGYPRLINVICDRALLTGFVEEARTIGPKIVRECAAELTIPGPDPRPARDREAPHHPPEEEETEQTSQISPPIPHQPLPPTMPLHQSMEDVSATGTEFIAPEQPIGSPEPTQPAMISRHSRRDRTKKHTWTFAAILLLLGILMGTGYLFFSWNQKNTPPNTKPAPSVSTKKEPPPTPSSPITQAPPPVPSAPTAPEKTGTTQNIPAPDTSVVSTKAEAISQPAPPQLPETTEKTVEPPKIKDLTNTSTESSPLLPPYPLEQPLIISFDYDSNEIQPETFKLLERFAQTVLHSPTVTEIVIRGYSDNAGSESYNQRLSNFRAQLIRSFLMGKGITNIPFTILAVGSKNPVASNETLEGKKKNRRVELRAVIK